VLHLLALHQDIQHELRCEIKKATLGGDLSYDKLMSLPYLEAILKETLLKVCVLWCVVVRELLIAFDLQVSSNYSAREDTIILYLYPRWSMASMGIKRMKFLYRRERI
jgi:hypothetical protein